jgi:hypothetical protein
MMNAETQKRRIIRFLNGRNRDEIDTFCIYQWIDRCHFHGWYDLGLALASHVPPDSLDAHRHKRLDYLLSECRSHASQNTLPVSRRTSLTPRVARTDDEPGNIRFESRSNETLRQIYVVLYYMVAHDQEVAQAIRLCMKTLQVKDYQTVCDKCARRFAGTIEDFKRWVSHGVVLSKLNERFNLSPRDLKIFESLLGGLIERGGHGT